MRQRRLRKRRAAVVAVLSCEQSPRILVSSSVNNLIVIITPRRQRATRTQHRHPESWVRPHITFNTEDRNLRTAYRYPHDETNFLCLSPFKLCIPPPYRHHHSTITRPLAGGFLLCSLPQPERRLYFQQVYPANKFLPAATSFLAHIFSSVRKGQPLLQAHTTFSGPLLPSAPAICGKLTETASSAQKLPFKGFSPFRFRVHNFLFPGGCVLSSVLSSSLVTGLMAF